MTDISFLRLTESVAEVDRCCKEIVAIDLPECCLGIEFNFLTVLRGGAEHGGSEKSDCTESLGTASTSKKPHTQAHPPPADPADESAPAPAAPTLAGISGRAGARAGCVPTQGRGQRRSQHARLCQINLVVLDECCSVACRTRTAIRFPAEIHLRA